eukprot:TRINITY_DN3153_c2_g2_i1.p1 TRINITY_DN3153_c2_g2~~TRINITY_DN3153_c2_g2_i1.p1  ORF type:complete len:927 (+),score=235.20 TRINITY_DN3153_c2_g2_i1:216-2996(+)
MEPDENKMLRAAYIMVQSLAGSFASVTAKEPLRTAITNNLRAALGASRNQLPSHIEHAILTVVSDNLELACGAIQKAASDAAYVYVESLLRNAVTDRKNHRDKIGKNTYYDINFVGSPAYAYVSRLPEALKPKMGGVTPQQLQVYEEFANISSQSMASSQPGSSEQLKDNNSQFRRSNLVSGYQDSYPVDQAIRAIEQLLLEICNILVNLLSQNRVRSLSDLPQDSGFMQQFAKVSDLISTANNRYEAGLFAAHISLTKLYEERTNSIFREVFVTVLRTATVIVPKVRSRLTEYVLSLDSSRKFNKEVIPVLLQQNLIEAADYDVYLAKSLSSNDKVALEFAITMFKIFTRTNSTVSLSQTLKELERTIQIPDAQNFLDGARRVVPVVQDITTLKDPSAQKLEEKASQYYNEWLELYSSSAFIQAPDKPKSYVQNITQSGFYGTKDNQSIAENFFYKVAIERTVQAFLATVPKDEPSGRDQEKIKTNIRHIDAFAKFTTTLLKLYPDPPVIFNRIINSLFSVIEKDYNSSPTEFDQRPYFRMIVALLMEFNAPEAIFESHMLTLLLKLRDMFHKLRPTLYPGFTFAWLELISHRMFMPKLLKDPSGWEPMQELLVDLLQFLEPSLRTAQMSDPVRLLYQGTLRVLLVLLHDFPEFLCDYHFSFCNVIPSTCVQMRNLILSAFPRTMKLPDPFTPNLKVDLLPEIKESPRIRSTYLEALILSNLKSKLDGFLRSLEPSNFLEGLVEKIKLTTNNNTNNNQQGEDSKILEGSKYNLSLINSLILYVGAKALPDSPEQTDVLPEAPMDIFRYLASQLDNEGRYCLFNAIANQLRYPNNHTHYFSCVLLYLFAESKQEIVQEQITRVLVERLIVHRPHPWGLLITFIELIKNSRYNFWSRGFTHCAPEIERLFYQVYTSISQSKGDQEPR